MTYKTRKRVWPLAVMSLAVFGVLAAVVALTVLSSGTAQADSCDDTTLYPTFAAQIECIRAHTAAGDDHTTDHSHDPTPEPTAEPTPAPTPQPEPQASTFVANAAAGRTVELEWPSITDATSYVIRFRNLDMAGSAYTMRAVTGNAYTLADADLVDGALYEVQLRGNNQSWADARTLQILGPVIQFSSETPFKEFTGEPVSWTLPYAVMARGDMVRYSIAPALPAGLSYGQETGKNYVDLANGVNPMISGGVTHGTGGSDQFYRLTGCDVDDGIVDAASCDTHIFRAIITPATVKPLADVIRDREYTIGVALNDNHPRNQFPQVGLGSGSGFTYQLLDTKGYRELIVPGLTFNPNTRQLSGTPVGPPPEEPYRVAYRATPAGGGGVYHEAEFVITIMEIVRQECRVGLNYESTQQVYNMTDTVGSANFTVRAASDSYYVLPIGEKGQRGAGENRTRTFELITVVAGGDLSAANANDLPPGLQVVQLMVDGASVNPLNDLYTRQGFYEPAGAVMPQMMDAMNRYQDPEPEYPDVDNGHRLAIGVSNKDMLKEGNHLSCFIVHDTDNDTGETDSSAVVFSLNILPDLSARDWVIELNGPGDVSELDVEEAFTTAPNLLDFSVMYVDDGAARDTATGCIANAAAAPQDIVNWSTSGDTVTFTAEDVAATTTQRVQVKAALKTGGAEACVQIRITVLPEHVPADLTAPSNVVATADGNEVTITWDDGANADRHVVFLFDSNLEITPSRIAGNQTDGETTFSNVPAGSYTAVVVAVEDGPTGNAMNIQYSVDMVTVN